MEIVIGVLGVILLAFIVLHVKLKTELTEKRGRYRAAEEENGHLKEKNDALARENTEQSVRLEQERRHNEETKRLMEERLTKEFELISSRMLKQQQTEFGEKQTSRLTEILQPFNKDMKDFRDRIEIINQDNLKGRTELKAQIDGLGEMHKGMSKDAQDLTEALKGNSKVQGDWGEIQLERVLEIAGLEKGIVYEKQVSMKSEETSRNQRPDYLIRLPDDRTIIIDSKVSLTAYVEYMSTKEDTKKKDYLKKHISSIRNHIKELSSREYQKLIPGLDYVFMFIPIENAYMEAWQGDDKLYEQAYQQGVAVTTPSSLLPILRAIESLWKMEKQHRHVEEIAGLGGKLYDKLHGFIGDMNKIGRSLGTARESYDKAFKKLSSGQGNAIALAEKMKSLGAKTGKQIEIEADRQELLEESGG